MFDVTKATLLFAKGVVLVEGISEALLLPALAERLGLRIGDAGISIIPIAGVDFASIAKLFGEEKLTFPVAILTDGDPAVDVIELHGAPGEKPTTIEFPYKGDVPKECARVTALRSQFAGNSIVSVFSSSVTLEYDMSLADISNSVTIWHAWDNCYDRSPRTLTLSSLEAAADAKTRAVLIWRAICRGTPLHGKGELAQSLAAHLGEKADGTHKHPFVVPSYIEAALRHAMGLTTMTAP